MTLKNSEVRLEFDLSTGSYDIYNQAVSRPVIAKAKLKINQWASDADGVESSWSQREVSDALGQGLALDLSFTMKGAPELHFSFILYEGDSFLSATGGIHNTSEAIIRVKDIHVAADAGIYQDYDVSRDFAMIDGFSGGEPLEYGERFYSPLTHANALKSRNNIFLTFTDGRASGMETIPTCTNRSLWSMRKTGRTKGYLWSKTAPFPASTARARRMWSRWNSPSRKKPSRSVTFVSSWKKPAWQTKKMNMSI